MSSEGNISTYMDSRESCKIIFFFSSRRRHTRFDCDWSSDVCSSDLPGGIFNRSFIRAYAKFIGYDENNALEDYARTLRERGESDHEGSKSHHSLVYTDDGNAHSRSSLRTLVLAILILPPLSAAAYIGLRFYQRNPHAPSRREPRRNDTPRTAS